MEIEFLFEGETFSLIIEEDRGREPGGYKAVIREKEYSFDVSRISDNCFSLLFQNNSRLVYAAANDGKVFVHIDGKVIKLESASDVAKTFAKEGVGFGDKDKITTSMPGKVVKVLVDEGDRVKIDQPLVIVESMKMENEIISPTDGTVKSIHFGAGDLVEPDQPIIILEPDE